MFFKSFNFKVLVIGVILFIFYVLSSFSPSFCAVKFKYDYLAMIVEVSWQGDMAPSMRALELWKDNPYNYDLYSKLWFEEDVYHTWSPSTMLYFLPLYLLDGERFIFKWNLVLKLLTIISAVLVPMIFLKVWRITRPTKRTPLNSYDKIMLFITLFLITLAFYPLMRGLFINQIQTVITFLQVLTLFFLVSGKDKSSAIAIGLISAVKPHYIVVFLWMMIDRRWRPLLAGLVVFFLVVLMGVLVFGPTNSHSYYFKVIPHISSKGYAFYPNQSINGLLNRLFHNGSIIHWQANYSLDHPIITPITLINSVFFMVLALCIPVVRRLRKRDLEIDEKKKKIVSLMELSLVFIAVTLASPIAWEHNYGCVLPIGVALYAVLINTGIKRWIKLALLSISWFSIAYYWEVRQLADTPFNILISYSFFGGIILIIVLISEILGIRRYTDRNSIE